MNQQQRIITYMTSKPIKILLIEYINTYMHVDTCMYEEESFKPNPNQRNYNSHPHSFIHFLYCQKINPSEVEMYIQQEFIAAIHSRLMEEHEMLLLKAVTTHSPTHEHV